jgi:sugar lactone lactonase YvrE
MQPVNCARHVAAAALLFLVASCSGGDGIQSISPSGRLELLAGSVGGYGNLDGPADVARFTSLRGVAIDSAGVAYVADGSAIRSVSPAGEVKTLAGQTGATGRADGPGSSARFNLPIGVVVHPSGDLIVADTQNNILRRVTPSGVVSTYAGSGARGSDDGPALQATLDAPVNVVIDRHGDVVFSDWGTIRRIDASGRVTTIASVGLGVVAFAFDAQNVLHVFDGSSRQFLRLSSSGNPTLIAQFPAPSSNIQTLSVWDMVVGADGNFYAPVSNQIWRISPTGTVEVLAGQWNATSTPPPVDGTGIEARFQGTTGIAMDAGGALLVADLAAGTLRHVDPDGRVTTLAGRTEALGHRDGVGGDVRFARLEDQSSGLVMTPSGTLLLADDTFVRAIDPQGRSTTMMQAPGLILRPHWLTLTTEPSGKLILAGSSPTYRTSDGRTGALPGATAAANASALATDENGNLYATYNEYSREGCRDRLCFPYLVGSELRRISPGGQATVLAGDLTRIGAADGGAGTALFSDARGIAVDRDGIAYLADSRNHTVRRITPHGPESTLAGKAGEPGAVDGPGAAARLNQPIDVALGPRGALYVADAGNQLVRRIGPDGIVTTVVGTPGSVGVKLGALPASLGDLSAIASDGERLYIATRSAVLVAVPPSESGSSAYRPRPGPEENLMR